MHSQTALFVWQTGKVAPMIALGAFGTCSECNETLRIQILFCNELMFDVVCTCICGFHLLNVKAAAIQTEVYF